MCQKKSTFEANLEHAFLNLPQICRGSGMSSEQIDDKNRKVIEFIILQQVEQCFDRSVVEQAAIPIRYTINNRHWKARWKTSTRQNVIWRQSHRLNLRRHIVNRFHIGHVV